jgi:hypothetical protein
MKAVQTSVTLVNSYRSTRRYNPEDSHHLIIIIAAIIIIIIIIIIIVVIKEQSGMRLAQKD